MWKMRFRARHYSNFWKLCSVAAISWHYFRSNPNIDPLPHRECDSKLRVLLGEPGIKLLQLYYPRVFNGTIYGSEIVSLW
jgi:hypothetical protein